MPLYMYRCWFSFSIFTVGKVCDKPILKDVTTFPDFSGSGSSNYRNARFSASGWCASGSTPYLLIDLKKEYHITRVVVMGNKDQTKWSGSYLMKYGHDKTYKESQKVFMTIVIQWMTKASRLNSNKASIERKSVDQLHLRYWIIYKHIYIKIINKM
jgi:hypothetical protein